MIICPFPHLHFVYMEDLWQRDLYDFPTVRDKPANQEGEAEVTPEGKKTYGQHDAAINFTPFISFFASLGLVLSFCMSACITDPSPL